MRSPKPYEPSRYLAAEKSAYTGKYITYGESFFDEERNAPQFLSPAPKKTVEVKKPA